MVLGTLLMLSKCIFYYYPTVGWAYLYFPNVGRVIWGGASCTGQGSSPVGITLPRAETSCLRLTSGILPFQTEPAGQRPWLGQRRCSCKFWAEEVGPESRRKLLWTA